MKPGQDPWLDQRLEMLVDEIVDYALYLLEPDGRIATWNSGAERLKGYSREEIVGRHYEIFFTPEDRSTGVPQEELDGAAREGRVAVEGWRVRKDGTRFWAHAVVTALRTEDGSLLGFGKVTRDRSEARAKEEELQRSVAQYQSLVEHSPDAIFVNHADRVVLVNPACLTLFGAQHVDELLGKSPFDLFHPDDHDRIRQRIRRLRDESLSVPAVEERIVRLDGAVVEVEVSASPFPFGEVPAIHVILRDIGPRKQLEAKFLQAQRLESVGRLAGGIAHDFNNLMAVIGGTAELAQGSVAPNHPVAADLRTIGDAVARAAALTGQLLAFSRRQVLRPTVVDLNMILKELEPMLRRLIRADIELVLRLAPAPDLCRVDTGQMGQVLLNLVVNARDAMPRGGRLILETANIEIDEDYAATRPGVAAGPHVTLVVSDSGVGMDASTREQIFEPFFTTKAAGEGTGLGLSTVYGIIRQSGGHIGVYSEVGHGTVFRIFLPAVVDAASRVEPRPQSSASPRGAGELILVVEDANDLRELVGRALLAAGYRVLLAADSEEAIAHLSGSPEPVALVFSDLVMPGLSGPEMRRHLEQLQPGLRFLFTSGYAPGTTSWMDQLGPGVDFIGKPFSVAGLASKVREVLDREVSA